jgi:hypothetical protein
MSRTKPTRREMYHAAHNLRSNAGCSNARIAKILGCGVSFVETLFAAAEWPESRRNAWLMGLNVEKFRCG